MQGFVIILLAVLTITALLCTFVGALKHMLFELRIWRFRRDYRVGGFTLFPGTSASGGSIPQEIQESFNQLRRKRNRNFLFTAALMLAAWVLGAAAMYLEWRWDAF